MGIVIEANRQRNVWYENICLARDLMLGPVVLKRIELALGVVRSSRCMGLESNRVDVGTARTFLELELGQLTSIYAQNASLHKFTSFGYSYTNPNTNKATGLPYSVTDTAGNVTTNTYDAVNQLTQAVQKTSGGTTLHSYSFGFDPAGNMTSKSVDGTNTTFTYNAADELTQASGGINKTYTYDGNGDLTSISDGTQLTLNAAGQITSVTPPGGGPINMTYTGAERRSESVPGPRPTSTMLRD